MLNNNDCMFVSMTIFYLMLFVFGLAFFIGGLFTDGWQGGILLIVGLSLAVLSGWLNQWQSSAILKVMRKK